MRTLRDRVLSPDGGVPARLRAALCGDAALEQLAGISGVNAERSRDDAAADDDDPDGVDDAANAAETAHEILTRLCLDPAHGLCPASALGRWEGPDGSGRGSREPADATRSGSGSGPGAGAGRGGGGCARGNDRCVVRREVRGRRG